jgi:neurotransmitter:Na+ symporter, NSS family
MAKVLDSSVNQRFVSRFGFLISVLGISVGTGNIWRFPRIVAQNGGDDGGGAFLIAWTAFLFLWAIPLIIAEYALGRKYRSGVVSTFIKVAGNKFAWGGAFVTFVSTAITFFYSVVVGWCIFYFFAMLFNPLPMSTESATQLWNNYQNSLWPIVFHGIAMGLGAIAIWKGINSIERVNKILIPVLFIIIIISVIRALTLPGAWDGIAYLFTPQWNQLIQPRIWIEALTQNAWDTGAGWGLFLTYAAYMSVKQGVVKNAFITGIGNNVVSLLGALMMFGTVFAVLQTEMGMSKPEVLEIMKTSGPASTGLTFIWMPQLFARMFFGHPFAVLFFLGLAFAGFSSLIAHLELPVRNFIDAGMKRSTSIFLTVGLSFIFGIPSAVNLNILANQDFVWGTALMLSGAMVAYTVIKHGTSVVREKDLSDTHDWKLGKWWDVVIKLFIPLAAVFLLIWWLSLSTDVEQWYNPFNYYGIMTCLFQWAVILGIFIGMNRWMANKYTDTH